MKWRRTNGSTSPIAAAQYGATILTDCKNGSDKPNDNTLRLTLVRSPGVDNSYTDQANQDWGHHEMRVRHRRSSRRLA